MPYPTVLKNFSRLALILVTVLPIEGRRTANAQPPHSEQTFWVDSVADDANVRSSDKDGLITLREAIMAATSQRPFGDAPAGARTNNIELGLLQTPLKKNTARISLNAPISIYSNKQVNVFIFGDHRGRNVVVDGGEKHQLFQVSGEVALSFHWVDLVNGRATNGGAICVNNRSSLSFYQGEITKCRSERDGGAIFFNSNAVLRTANASFLDNQAGSLGGAICVADGDLDADHVTVARNEAGEYGGGLHVCNRWHNLHSITQSTIVQNSAYSTGPFPQGGGIAESVRSTGEIYLEGTLIASNIAPINGFRWNNDVGASFSPASFANLIGSAWVNNGLTDGTRRNQVGTVFAPIAPMLSSLGYHGSGSSRNYIPNPNSPAIDAGQPRPIIASGFAPKDQRGQPRFSRGYADIGSVERQEFPR